MAELTPQSSAVIDLWEELFQRKDKKWLKVLSDSMAPLLKMDDMVLIVKVNPEDVKVGNIIVFKSQGKLETHRVIRISRGAELSILQKGDNVRTAEIITGERLIGKTVAVKKGSRIMQFDSILGKVINFVLTFFSVSTYYLYQKNSIVLRIVRFALNKMKKIFLYGLKKWVF